MTLGRLSLSPGQRGARGGGVGKQAAGPPDRGGWEEAAGRSSDDGMSRKAGAWLLGEGGGQVLSSHQLHPHGSREAAILRCRLHLTNGETGAQRDQDTTQAT